MTKMADAMRDNFCPFLETEVTSMFIRSSMLLFPKSFGMFWDRAGRASSKAMASAMWRNDWSLPGPHGNVCGALNRTKKTNLGTRLKGDMAIPFANYRGKGKLPRGSQR